MVGHRINRCKTVCTWYEKRHELRVLSGNSQYDVSLLGDDMVGIEQKPLHTNQSTSKNTRNSITQQIEFRTNRHSITAK